MKTEFKASFLKTINKLRDVEVKDNIAVAIENVEAAGSLHEIRNLRKLKGYKDYYRIKIDKYRIGIRITEQTVYFVDIDHRKDIYKHFP